MDYRCHANDHIGLSWIYDEGNGVDQNEVKHRHFAQNNTRHCCFFAHIFHCRLRFLR